MSSREASPGHFIRVVAHGGAGSDASHADGTDRAARAAFERIRKGVDVLDAAVHAVVLLEDDVRFNAGTGSSIRVDGRTIQMDASCMDSAGTFGAVAVIENVRNPVLVAREVARTPHILLAGQSATAFARARGFAAHDPATPQARAKHASARELRESKASDTVGCVASDGARFAAALSTGGPVLALLGRVGDVPLPGGGLWAGPAGAVAATGQGEAIARGLFAHRVYGLLEQGRTGAQAVAEGLSWFPNHIDVGLIAVGRGDASGGSNRSMAWSMVEG